MSQILMMHGKSARASGHSDAAIRPLEGRWTLGFDKVASSSYFIDMRAVGLKTLKNKLSEYVRLAGNGETVLVTDRDRVVAELSPPRAGRSEVLADAMLAEAMRRDG